MSAFKEEKPCQSVRIWSRKNMTDDMFSFGWHVFNKYNLDLQFGHVSVDGCVYSDNTYAAFAKKTRGGCASVCVEIRS